MMTLRFVLKCGKPAADLLYWGAKSENNSSWQRTHYLLPPGSESIETFYHWVSRASSIISLTFIDVITLMTVPRVS